ncbi:MAG: peroxiredoxin-like family protein [Microscillaceae bacterium]
MKKLQDELTELLGQFPGFYPKEIYRQTTQIHESGQLRTVPKLKDQAPSFALPNQKGQSIRLEQVLARGPVVLSFYRGDWCPFCDLELRALQKNLLHFQRYGATLIGISPQLIHVVEKRQSQKLLSYDLLSDQGNRIARQYGLVFKMEAHFAKMHLDVFNIRLEEYQLPPLDEMIIPATFVIDQAGEIAFVYANPDYTKRAEPADIIAVLMQLSQAHQEAKRA